MNKRVCMCVPRVKKERITKCACRCYFLMAYKQEKG